MVDIQSFIYSNISSIIKKEFVDYSSFKDRDFLNLLTVSVEHQIHMLIYETIMKSGLDLNPKVMNFWKKEVIHTDIERQFLEKSLLDLLKSIENTDYVLLKGISYSKLYSDEKKRAMSDIDLLVSKDTFEEMNQLLISLGYHLNSENEEAFHYVYDKDNSYRVEVHTGFSKDSSLQLDNLLLLNKVKSEYKGHNYYECSYEDSLLYCIYHMYKHFLVDGFGLKQLIDLYYLSERVDVDEVLLNIKSMKLYNFTKLLYQVIDEVFKVNFMVDDIKDGSELLDKLMDDIFKSGVYGFSDQERYLNLRIADHSSNNRLISKMRSYLFPSRKHLLQQKKYNYVKFAVLLPIAWLHRIIFNVVDGKLKLNIHQINNESISNRVELKTWIQKQ